MLALQFVDVLAVVGSDLSRAPNDFLAVGIHEASNRRPFITRHSAPPVSDVLYEQKTSAQLPFLHECVQAKRLQARHSGPAVRACLETLVEELLAAIAQLA